MIFARALLPPEKFTRKRISEIKRYSLLNILIENKGKIPILNYFFPFFLLKLGKLSD